MLSRRAILAVVFVATLALVSGASGLPLTEARSGQFQPLVADIGPFVAGQVLVRWAEGGEKGLAQAQLLAAVDGEAILALEPLPLSVVRVPEGRELDAIADLERSPLVRYAEPDYLAFASLHPGTGASAAGTEQAQDPDADYRQVDQAVLATQGYLPNDSAWLNQWAVRRVEAPLAWEVTTGSSQVVVAVIDSGIDLNHPEFSGRLLPGYDYVNKDSTPQDDFGHGTQISGIIAATGNNQIGVAGLAWNVRLLPLKALDNNGVGPVSNLIQAILYANVQNVDVINLSLALSGHSQGLYDAIRVAYNNSVVIVASTGNSGGPVSYPALYPEVIAVAATTRWDQWAPYSNFGSQVDVAAPGGQDADRIYSTSLYGGYGSNYGTSLAAAHVTGLVALMRSLAPEANVSSIVSTLRNTAAKVGDIGYPGGRNDYLGYGRMNAAQALRQILPPELAFSTSELHLMAEISGSLPEGTVTLQNLSSQQVTWQLIEISEDWLDVDAPWSGVLTYPATARLQVRIISPMAAGTHTALIRLRTTDLAQRQQTYTVPVSLTVVNQLWRMYLPAVEGRHLTTSWLDGVESGIGLTLSGDGAQAVGLPFAFPFYDRTYTSVWVHANGFLSFERSYSGSRYATNTCLPSATEPNGAIYALWDDLDPSRGGRVAYNNVENRYFVVEWRNVPRHSGNGANTFQVALWPDGRVLLQYDQVVSPDNATVGLENWDATMGWGVACNGGGSLPVAGRAWLFSTALP